MTFFNGSRFMGGKEVGIGFIGKGLGFSGFDFSAGRELTDSFLLS